MKTLAAALALLLPGLAMAQSPGPNTQQVSENGSPPPEPKKKKDTAFVIEGFVGPALMSHPDVNGLAYGAALRFLKHSGLRTDFGLVFFGGSYATKDLTSVDGVSFDNSQSQIGGSLELNIGFGISVVELMFGGGLGLASVNGTVTSSIAALGKRDYGSLIFLPSYGGELGFNLGPLRPVLRITRLVDTGFDSETAQTGDATATLILGGLGVSL